MKGLFVKDLMLLKKQKYFFIIMFIMGLLFLIADYDVNFTISYLTIVSGIFSITTTSYDEYNNSNAFLFTLPFKRQDYIKEKYLFSLLTSCLGWLVAIIMALASQFIKNQQLDLINWITTCLIYIILIIILLTISIPTQLKFGGERGRVALIMVCAMIGVIGYLIYSGLKVIGIDLATILDSLSTIDFSVVILIALLASIVMMFISSLISIKIINNKEF